MPTSIAHVQTELPRRYLSQLCKHFEHKLPVILGEETGQITFGSGICTLRAEAAMLVMQVDSPDAETLARTEDVVARHLLRFAFRIPPEIVWQPGAETPTAQAR